MEKKASRGSFDREVGVSRAEARRRYYSLSPEARKNVNTQAMKHFLKRHPKLRGVKLDPKNRKHKLFIKEYLKDRDRVLGWTPKDWSKEDVSRDAALLSEVKSRLHAHATDFEKTEKRGVITGAKKRKLPTARLDEVTPVTNGYVRTVSKQKLEKSFDDDRVRRAKSRKETERIISRARAPDSVFKKIGVKYDRSSSASRRRRTTRIRPTRRPRPASRKVENTFERLRREEARLRREGQMKHAHLIIYGDTEYQKARRDISDLKIKGNVDIVDKAKHVVIISNQKVLVCSLEKKLKRNGKNIKLGKIVSNLTEFMDGSVGASGGLSATNLPPGYSYILDVRRRNVYQIRTVDGKKVAKKIGKFARMHYGKRMTAKQTSQAGYYGIFFHAEGTSAGMDVNRRYNQFLKAVKNDNYLVVRVAAPGDMMPKEDQQVFKISEALARSRHYLGEAAKDIYKTIKKDKLGAAIGALASLVRPHAMQESLKGYKEYGEATRLARHAGIPDETYAAAQLYAKGFVSDAVGEIFSRAVKGVVKGTTHLDALKARRLERKLIREIDATKPGIKAGRPNQPLRQHLFLDGHAEDFARISGNAKRYQKIVDAYEAAKPVEVKKVLEKLKREDPSEVRVELARRRAIEKLEKQGKHVDEQPYVSKERMATADEYKNAVEHEKADLSRLNDKEVRQELSQRMGEEVAYRKGSKRYIKMVKKELLRALKDRKSETVIFEADYYSVKDEFLGRQRCFEYTTKEGYRALVTFSLDPKKSQLLNTFDVLPEGTKIGENFVVPSPTKTYRNRFFLRGSNKEWLQIRETRLDQKGRVGERTTPLSDVKEKTHADTPIRDALYESLDESPSVDPTRLSEFKRDVKKPKRLKESPNMQERKATRARKGFFDDLEKALDSLDETLRDLDRKAQFNRMKSALESIESLDKLAPEVRQVGLSMDTAKEMLSFGYDHKVISRAIEEHRTAGYKDEEIGKILEGDLEMLRFLKDDLCGGSINEARRALKRPANDFDIARTIEDKIFHQLTNEYRQERGVLTKRQGGRVGPLMRSYFAGFSQNLAKNLRDYAVKRKLGEETASVGAKIEKILSVEEHRRKLGQPMSDDPRKLPEKLRDLVKHQTDIAPLKPRTEINALKEKPKHPTERPLM
jgi:hypothetical protein